MLPSTQIQRNINFILFFSFFFFFKAANEQEAGVSSMSPYQSDHDRFQMTLCEITHKRLGTGRVLRSLYAVCLYKPFSFQSGTTAALENGCKWRRGGARTFPQLSSSGFACSNSRTWVKGKWPRLPLHSPSHWPFTLILVTFTMSPTCLTTANNTGFPSSVYEQGVISTLNV